MHETKRLPKFYRVFRDTGDIQKTIGGVFTDSLSNVEKEFIVWIR